MARLLLVVQAGLLLVAMLGEIAMMGSPVYAIAPVVNAIALMVLARKVAAARRWAMITTIVLQAVTITGFWLAMLVGLLAPIDHTTTVAGLITDLCLPVTLIVLCGRLLAATPRAGRAAGTPDAELVGIVDQNVVRA